ncbi:uncharacterized protein PV09_00211 [Verruconis gallopava]|uniref:CN hydrolase domain-containing protein n=1 Tax=Verruconis gallopava TaxID=253628 RepID=A0A0D2BCY5_9PEZI|nr:uncharacterized protein PV09_00211 [Verruconis gallopava]KIW09294.1 hypothetical protein PV09_00211 [Verruconis gallopava]
MIPTPAMKLEIKIACLQFAPEVGKVNENIARAERILEKNAAKLRPPDDGKPLWLVLPEMAFSGYNFKSLEEITPYLEPSCAGPSTQWAKSTACKYGIYITVGYPETVSQTAERRQDDISEDSKQHDAPQANYNSTVTVSPAGEIIATYRKRFLYYTDETWALEGDGCTSSYGFYNGNLGPLGDVAMGICMDINNYKFLSPWTAYEFANHVISSNTPLVVLSMAWLTRMTKEELEVDKEKPDLETLSYWIERFSPLRENTEGRQTVIVVANRCGIEEDACYAGTSSVIRLDGRGAVEIFDLCGKNEERLMVVDLSTKPKYFLQRGAA